MKESIIKLNDSLATLMVLVITIFGIVWGVGAGGDMWIAVGGGAGFVIGALLSGLWFVLSGIYEQLREANRQLKILQSGTTGANSELEEIKRLIAGPSS